jgi:YD repeat-containing protein
MPDGGADSVWVEDALPLGATAGGDYSWNWVSASPAPFSGALAHQSAVVAGMHQHYFSGATSSLPINDGESFFVYVYLDPANLPSEIMLQWNDGGGWEHRAYWGANNISSGVNGTDSRRYLGPLPTAGEWMRLDIAASQVGLEGHAVSGMAFAQYNGRATWDRAGKTTPLSTSINLALNKSATQSTTLGGASGTTAERAVDGNSSGNWADASIASTTSESQAWWQVDLGSVQPIESIKIWNRTDCCGDRLSDFYLFLSDQPFTSTDLTATQSQAGVSSYQTSGQGGATTTVNVNRSARHVRVQLAGSNYLSLAEVQVFQPPPTNLALNKTATQSSNLGATTTAAKAIDGNSSGNWADGSIASTQAENQAWWQVDLGSVQALQAIKVWNRTDCCSDRLSSFYVFVSDQPFSSSSLSTTQTQAGVTGYYTAGAGGSPTLFNLNRSGRYVRIQLSGANYLSLAEVQVQGIAIPMAASNPPAASITSPANNASFITPANITINGSASDSDGSISKVEFFQGATKLGEDTSAPYSFIWNDVAVGSYALSVVATDNAGVTTTSGSVNVAVTVPPSSVSGKVTKAVGTTAISGATVRVMQGATVAGTATTNNTGDYSVTGLTAGTYAVEATASGFGNKIQSGVTLTVASTQTLNLNLDAIESGPFEYVYDELGRLISVVGPTETAVYSYDSVGNLLSITRHSSASASLISFAPASGAAGALVTINGTGFSPTANQNTVTFNGVAASITSATTTRIEATVPPGATTGDIAVTSPSGSATSSMPFVVTPSSSQAPTITGISPTLGVPGAVVNITGANFETIATDNKVKFNLARAALTSATATSMVASAPTGTSGRISVSTPSGAATSNADFFIAPAPYAAADIQYTGRMAVGNDRNITLNGANKAGIVLFDGAIGQRISLKFSSANVSMGVKIYNPDGTVLITGALPTWGIGFIEPQPLPVSGTYSIVVNTASNSSGDGAINLSLYDVLPDTSGTITLGGSEETVTNVSPGQNGRLTFNGTANQKVSLLASNVTIEGGYVSIYKPDGTLLASTGVNAVYQRAFIDAQTLPATGVYTVLIDPGNYAVGSVTVKLYNAADLTDTITLDAAADINIQNPGQNVRLTFTGTAGQRVSLRASNVSLVGSSSQGISYNGGVINILNPGGTALASLGIFDNNGGFLDTKTLPADGAYTIFVDLQNATTASMRLTLYNVPADINGAIAADGLPVTVSVSVPGQDARLTFNGTAGQKVSLIISNVSIAGGSINIDAADGTHLASTVVNQVYGDAYIDTTTLPANGSYTIAINPGGYATGSVRLQLYDASDMTGTITAGGVALTLTNDRPGRNALLTFSGNENQLISLTANDSTVSGTIYIKKPDGTNLTYKSVNNNGAFIDAQLLPVAGTYTILVDPLAASIGSMVLTLYDASDLTGGITIGGAAVGISSNVPGRNTRLAFDATAGQQLTLHVTNNNMQCLLVSLLQPSGASISSNSSGTSSFSLTSQSAPATGTYTINIDPCGNVIGNLTVSLTTP